MLFDCYNRCAGTNNKASPYSASTHMRVNKATSEMRKALYWHQPLHNVAHKAIKSVTLCQLIQYFHHTKGSITAFAPPEACLRIAHGSANSLAISSSASPMSPGVQGRSADHRPPMRKGPARSALGKLLPPRP